MSGGHVEGTDRRPPFFRCTFRCTNGLIAEETHPNRAVNSLLYSRAHYQGPANTTPLTCTHQTQSCVMDPRSAVLRNVPAPPAGVRLYQLSFLPDGKMLFQTESVRLWVMNFGLTPPNANTSPATTATGAARELLITTATFETAATTARSRQSRTRVILDFRNRRP